MSEYIKQNFQPGQVLKAAQLNYIEDGISKILPAIEAGEAKQLVTDTEGNLLWEKKVLDYTLEWVNLFEDVELTGENQCVTLKPLIYIEETSPVKVIINNNEYDATLTLSSDASECFFIGTFENITLRYIFSNSPITNSTPGTPNIINAAGTTGTLSIKIQIKKYSKIDIDYLPTISSVGTGYNSVILNNSKDLYYGSQSDGAYSVSANGGKALANASFAANLSTSSGLYSFSEGQGEAKGLYSHAEGQRTIASGKSQHAEGTYNIEDIENKYAHIVGNGYYDSENKQTIRSNAYTLDWNGNGCYAGDVECKSMILNSSTEGSTKRFKITVDDNGTISATEITE